MTNWVRVAMLSEVPPGACLETVAGDRIVALFNVDGTVYALDGVCPHQGGPLGKGCLDGVTITCPWHGWQFDVRTGQNLLGRTVVQPGMPTRIEQEWIEVDVGATAAGDAFDDAHRE